VKACRGKKIMFMIRSLCLNNNIKVEEKLSQSYENSDSKT
jgi:hypothetical protein